MYVFAQLLISLMVTYSPLDEKLVQSSPIHARYFLKLEIFGSAGRKIDTKNKVRKIRVPLDIITGARLKLNVL